MILEKLPELILGAFTLVAGVQTWIIKKLPNIITQLNVNVEKLNDKIEQLDN